MLHQLNIKHRRLFATLRSSGYPKRKINNYTEAGDETEDGRILFGCKLRRNFGGRMREKRGD
jgi:hypothetical protein